MSLITTSIAEAFKAIGIFFGWIKATQDLNNSPEMQKGDEAKKEAKQNDEHRKNVEERNLGASRSSLAP